MNTYLVIAGLSLMGMISLVAIIILFTLLVRKKDNKRLEVEISSIKQQLIQNSTQHESHYQRLLEMLIHSTKENQQNFALSQEQLNSHVKRLQINAMQQILEQSQKQMVDIRSQITLTLQQQTEHLRDQIGHLTQATQEKLTQMSQLVQSQLNSGFEKTTATFNDVLKRLAIIDEAQKKITELSSNVVSLEAILADKKSRGTFGEVQLAGLIRNVIPEKHFALQHTLSNGKRVDCILFLPQPSGNLAIDSKFPLESYQLLNNIDLSKNEKRQLQQKFRSDIRTHIQDIAQKYIIKGETAEGAMMFIPAEAVFAEIHSNYPDLVETAHKAKVWLVSPTTMMAVLTTARAVLKDAATREQVHLIQQHLSYLAKDFQRFRERMEHLARHIKQAHQDVEEVNTSAKKITNRFDKIEQVEFKAEVS